MVDVADKTSLLCVLFFDFPIDICIERCLKRGAAGSDRTYDNVESSKKKRLDSFNKILFPLSKISKPRSGNNY